MHSQLREVWKKILFLHINSRDMQFLKGDKLLGSAQCQVLRGIAIMGIFLHNFCHLLKGSNEENEFRFIAERAGHRQHRVAAEMVRQSDRRRRIAAVAAYRGRERRRGVLVIRQRMQTGQSRRT